MLRVKKIQRRVIEMEDALNECYVVFNQLLKEGRRELFSTLKMVVKAIDRYEIKEGNNK